MLVLLPDPKPPCLHPFQSLCCCWSHALLLTMILHTCPPHTQALLLLRLEHVEFLCARCWPSLSS